MLAKSKLFDEQRMRLQQIDLMGKGPAAEQAKTALERDLRKKSLAVTKHADEERGETEAEEIARKKQAEAEARKERVEAERATLLRRTEVDQALQQEKALIENEMHDQ